MASLKAMNAPHLGAFLFFNALLIISVALPETEIPRFDGVVQDPQLAQWISRVAIALVGGIATLAANGLFPPTWKATIVFWRIRHVLPSHRAFTSIAPRDPRIDMQVLRRKISPWPNSPARQSACWYSLFKKHEKNPEIATEHRRFLLFRDLAGLSLLLMVIGSATLLVGAKLPSVGIVVGALALEYLIMIVAARNSSRALVANVLARECAS